MTASVSSFISQSRHYAVRGPTMGMEAPALRRRGLRHSLNKRLIGWPENKQIGPQRNNKKKLKQIPPDLMLSGNCRPNMGGGIYWQNKPSESQ